MDTEETTNTGNLSVSYDIVGRVVEARSRVGKADALLSEILHTEKLLGNRFDSLKMNMPFSNEVSESEPSIEVMNIDPLSQLEQQVEKTRQLWEEMERLTRQYLEELALIDAEEAVDTMWSNTFSSISWAKCWDLPHLEEIKDMAQKFQIDIPDDESGRLDRLVKILIFSSKELARGLDVIEPDYLKEFRITRRMSQDSKNAKGHQEERDRLKATFERLSQTYSKVSDVSRSIKSRWPEIILSSEEESEFSNLVNLAPRLIQIEPEVELLDSEEAVIKLYKRVLMAIEYVNGSKSELDSLRNESEKFEHNIPDDEADRLHRLAEILIFAGKALIHTLDVIMTTYYKSDKLAHKRLSFRKSENVMESKKLLANYDYLKQVSREVVGILNRLKGKWSIGLVPSRLLGQLNLSQEADEIVRKLVLLEANNLEKGETSRTKGNERWKKIPRDSVNDIKKISKKTIKTLEKTKSNTKNASDWYAKGMYLLGQGKYKDGIKCLDEAVRLDSGYVYTRNDIINDLKKNNKI